MAMLTVRGKKRRRMEKAFQRSRSSARARRCSSLPKMALISRVTTPAASTRYRSRRRISSGKRSETRRSRSLEKAVSYWSRPTTIIRGTSARPSPSRMNRAVVSQFRRPPEKAAAKKAPSREKGMRTLALKNSGTNMSPRRSS